MESSASATTASRCRGRGCSRRGAGELNPEGVAFYRALLEGLRERASARSSRCTTGTCLRRSRMPAAGRPARRPSVSRTTPRRTVARSGTSRTTGSPSTSPGARVPRLRRAPTRRAKDWRLRSRPPTTSTSPTGSPSRPSAPSNRLAASGISNIVTDIVPLSDSGRGLAAADRAGCDEQPDLPRPGLPRRLLRRACANCSSPSACSAVIETVTCRSSPRRRLRRREPLPAGRRAGITTTGRTCGWPNIRPNPRRPRSAGR